MEVKNMTNKTLPKVRYKISNGASAISYRTVDGRVLKRYCLNDVYRRILETHDGKFLSYLKELDLLDSDILVDIDEVFIGAKRLVGAMSYEYQPGTTINELYPKTNLIRLRNALVEADKRLRELDTLKLRDIHYRNIMYTGEIKIIDTDFCQFTDSDQTLHNVSHVNDFIIRGLFDLDINSKVLVDPRLRDVYDSVINGETGAYEFLDEYMDLEKESKGRCLYYKHLSKDFIGEKHGLFGRR